MNRGPWWATVHGFAESDMTEQLSVHTLALLSPVPELFLSTAHTLFSIALCSRLAYNLDFALNHVWSWAHNSGFSLLKVSFRSECMAREPTFKKNKKTFPGGSYCLWPMIQLLELSAEKEASLCCLPLSSTMGALLMLSSKCLNVLLDPRKLKLWGL